MSDVHAAQARAAIQMPDPSPNRDVMAVLRAIRPLRADGSPYDDQTNLTDAGFTSVEMVRIMLDIEAAFDLMIPQDMITPDNFISGAAITAMVQGLNGQS